MGRHYDVEEYGYKTAEELGSIVDSYTENPVEDTERLKDYLVGTIKNTVTGAVYNTAKKYLADKVAFSVAESINLGVVGDLYSTYALVTAPFIEVMGATMAGFGVGCVSYDLAPEFWTEVSNEVLGYFGVEPVTYEEIANLSMVVEVARHPVLNTMVYGMPYPVLDVIRAYMERYNHEVPRVSSVNIGSATNPNYVNMLGGSLYRAFSSPVEIGNITQPRLYADITRFVGTMQADKNVLPQFVQEGLSMMLVDTAMSISVNNIIGQFNSNYGTSNVMLEPVHTHIYTDTQEYSYTIIERYAFHPNFTDGNVRLYGDSYAERSGDGYTHVVVSHRMRTENHDTFVPYYVEFQFEVLTEAGQRFYGTTARWRFASYSTNASGTLWWAIYPGYYLTYHNWQYSNLMVSGTPLPSGLTQDYPITYTNTLEDIIPDKVSQNPNVTLVDDEEPTVYKTVYIPVPDDTVVAKDPTGAPEPIPDNKEIQFPNPTYHPTTPEHPEPSPYPPITGFKSPYIPFDGDCYTGMFAIYNPTKDQVISLSEFLWSANFIDTIKKLMGNPMDSIISLHKLYCTPETLGTSTIFCGYVETPVSGVKKVYNQFARVDCGILDISEFYNNVRDYEGYTTLELYLPFCTMVNLNVNDFMGKKIHVVYEVDVITGSCVAMVSVVYDNGKEKLLYTFNGNCAVSMPITSGGYNNLVSSLIGIAGSVATKNVGGVLGGVMSAVGQTVSVSGSISSNNGAMLPKKPYVLITRKVPNDFERRTWTATYQDNTPFTNLNSVTLPSGDNLIRIQEPRFNITGTSAILPDELEELKNIVSSGFYVHR